MLHDEIAQYLGSAVDGLAYDASGPDGNVFVDHVPSEPARCVGVYMLPGTESDSKLPYDMAEFRVTVRGDADSVWHWGVWQAVYNALHGLRNTTLPGGTYLVYALASGGGPNRLGDDENGRPAYSSTFRAETINTSRS